jgi:hypothetical protein
VIRLSEIKAAKHLLVEGRDCREFLLSLVRPMGMTESTLQIWDYGGNSELKAALGAFVRAPGFDRVDSLGVVRDAETNSAGALQSVRSALRSVGLPVPAKAGEVAYGHPSTSIFIFPDGDALGMLETLCLQAVAGSRNMICVDEFLQCLNSKGIAIANPDKAKLHAYLSSCQEPGLLVGQAAARGYLFTDDSVVYADLRSFITAL